MELFVHSII